jgi:hypothetical protein
LKTQRIGRRRAPPCQKATMMRELHVRPIHRKSMLEAAPKMTREVRFTSPPVHNDLRGINLLEYG